MFLVDAADELERDESLLRRLVNDGEIPAYRVGTRWVIAEPVVELLGQLERPAGRPSKDGGALRKEWRRKLLRTAEQLVPPPQAHVEVRRTRGRSAAPRGAAASSPTGAIGAHPAREGSDGRCFEPGCDEQAWVRGFCKPHDGRHYQRGARAYCRGVAVQIPGR